MQQLLIPYQESHRIELELINVDRDPQIKGRYGELIPVLTDSQNNEICHYFFDKQTFERYLDDKSS